MERDFLGLNRKNSSKMVKERSQDICNLSAVEMQHREYSSKLISPHQFQYSKTSREDDTLFQSHIGCSSQLPPLAKFQVSSNFFPKSVPAQNTWTSPFNKMPSDNSTNNVSGKIVFANNNRVTKTAKWQSSESVSIATPLSNPSPINGGLYDLSNKPSNLRSKETLTIFYCGAVHVFHDIPPEKAELIMHVAGTKPFTAEAKEILDQIIEENYGKRLAMARKATLARFLEKRKHRLSQARPYDINGKFVESYTPLASNMETMISSWQLEEMASSATG